MPRSPRSVPPPPPPAANKADDLTSRNPDIARIEVSIRWLITRGISAQKDREPVIVRPVWPGDIEEQHPGSACTGIGVHVSFHTLLSRQLGRGVGRHGVFVNNERH